MRTRFDNNPRILPTSLDNNLRIPNNRYSKELIVIKKYPNEWWDVVRVGLAWV